MIRKMIESLLGLFAVVTASGLYIGLVIGGILGWAYWMWMAIQFGSFGMFFFGILGPLGMIAAVLGLWSFVFGVPLWLLHLVVP